MHKPINDWNIDIQHDSGSESAPLLSSESHASGESAIFQDSETSDLDSAPTNAHLKYGSVETSSISSTATVIPKRSPPLTQDHALIPPLSLNTSRSLNVTQDRCYEIRKTDLVRIPQTI